METPLTPIDFARRACKLYGEREGVVDGNLRLTTEHARATRVFLRSAANWRGAGTDQLSSDAR